MRALFIAIIAMLSIPLFAASQSTLPTALGLIDSASRYFDNATDDDYGLQSVVVRIALFDTSPHASVAIPDWFTQTRDFGPDWDSSALRPIGIELIGDETQVITGKMLHEGSDFDEGRMALLAVRQDQTLYLFTAWSLYSDPVDDAIDIARKTLGIESPDVPPVPNVPYNTGGLWDLLPRIEHMPIGMTWDGDTQPCVGLLASAPCPDEATPQASPIP